MSMLERQKTKEIVERNNKICFRRGVIPWSIKHDAWVLPGGLLTQKVSLAKEAAELIEAMHVRHENAKGVKISYA